MVLIPWRSVYVQRHVPAVGTPLCHRQHVPGQSAEIFLQVLVYIFESLRCLTHCLPTTSFSVVRLQEMNSGIKSKPCEQPAGSSNARFSHKILSPPLHQRLLLELFPFLGICEKQVILKPLHTLFLFQVLALIAKGQQPENGLNSFQLREEQMQT